MGLPLLVSGAALVVISTAFFRLAVTNETDESYLQVLEFGFAVTLLLAGLGLVVIDLFFTSPPA